MADDRRGATRANRGGTEQLLRGEGWISADLQRV